VKPLRVAFLTASSHPDDGWGRFTSGLVSQLLDLGVEATLLTAEGGRSSSEMCGVRVHDCLPPVKDVERRRQLSALLRARPLIRRCSVVHCLSAPYAPLSRWLAVGRRLVITGIGTFLVRPLRDRRRARRFRAAYARADAIPCISRYTREALLAQIPELGCTPLIHPGVDTAKFRRLADPPAGAAKRILSVGALKERKGHEYTLRAFARVLDRVPDAELTIAGRIFQPRYLDGLRARIRELGIGERVSICTELGDDELIDRYQRAHLFALMSLNVGDAFEGYGQVFAEAAACGLPGVGSADCGAEDAVVDGQTGLLVKQKDVEGYSAAMIRLLLDDRLRERMADAAHAFAQTRSWRAAAERYMGVYSGESLD
jgi:glycosyltransferase involved in cell wall biosynthesis